MKKLFSGGHERGREAIILKKRTGFANCTINTFEEHHHYTLMKSLINSDVITQMSKLRPSIHP